MYSLRLSLCGADYGTPVSITAFSIVGPSTWNGVPLEVHLLPKNNESVFCRLLETDLYRRDWAGGAPLSRFLEGVLYKFLNE